MLVTDLAEKLNINISLDDIVSNPTIIMLENLFALKKEQEKEEKESLRKIANYAEVEKKLVVKRKCIVTFVGTLAFALSIMIGVIVFPKLPENSILRTDGLWLAIGVLGLVILWGNIIYQNRKNAKQE